MGSYLGHLIPGVFFMFIGVWWLINILWIYAKSLRNSKKEKAFESFKSSTWFPVPVKRLCEIPIEPLLRMVLVVVGIGMELTRIKWWWVNNHAHVAMYSAFLVWFTAEVLQFYKVLELPSCSEHLFGSFALFVEGLLFYFHLEGRSKMDQHLHVLLYVVIFTSAVVLVLEAWMKNSFLLVVVRSYLWLLQGTWFIQIALAIFSTKPWKNTKYNQEFVVIAFVWHTIAILTFVTISFAIVSCKVRGCRFRRNQRLEDVQMELIDEEGWQGR